MTIGLPSPFSFLRSNVIDPTQTLDGLLQDCQAPIFSNGLELRADESVFSYQSDVDFTPRIWEQARQDAGDYLMDEILFVPCSVSEGSPMYEHAGTLIKVTGRDGSGIEKHQRPLEPEEYDAWDEGMDWQNFTERYMRVPSHGTDTSVRADRMWHDGNRWYYFFYEDRGFGGCGNGGWRWSAKDKTATGERHFNMYLRSCMRTTYAKKFNPAMDIKASTSYWKAPTGSSKEDTYQFKSMIERNGYFYFRTHLNKPIKYKSWTTGNFDYSFMSVVSPEDVGGFKVHRKVDAVLPYDGKGYTKAIIDTTNTNGYASWEMLSTDEFNSIALGRLNVDSVDIRIENPETSQVLFELNNYFVHNNVDSENTEESVYTGLEYDSTVVLYTGQMIPSESIVKITLHGDIVEIGEVLGAKSIDAGFTKLAFKNKFKDFSPQEEDDWGNFYYKDGIKIHIHSGSVEFPIVRYDQLARLMILIGGKKVVINSSDSFNNEVPDGRKVFDATMMIARFTTFELDSSDKNKRIGEKAKYNFVLKEIV